MEQLNADDVTTEVALSWILAEFNVDLHDWLTLPVWSEQHWHAAAAVKIAKLYVKAMELDPRGYERPAIYRQCLAIAMEPFAPRT